MADGFRGGGGCIQRFFGTGRPFLGDCGVAGLNRSGRGDLRRGGGFFRCDLFNGGFFRNDLFRSDFFDSGLFGRAFAGGWGVAIGGRRKMREFWLFGVIAHPEISGKWLGVCGAACGSRIELVENFIRDFKVGEDVDGVLVVVELVVKFEDLSGERQIVDDARVLGNGHVFFGNDRESGGAEGVGDGAELVGRGVNRVFIFVALDVIGPGFDGEFHEFFLADGTGREADFAFAIELIGDAALGGDAAAVFGENRADIGSRSIEVIGGHFDDEGDAGGAVAFVSDFLDGLAAEFACAFFDGAVDVVLGHGDGLGIVDGGAEAGIGGGISTAGAGGKGDLMSAFAEYPAFDGVYSGFDVLDLGPLVMTGHGKGMEWRFEWE